MDFIDQLKQFSSRVMSLKDSIFTEEATKTSIIMPFFAMLGYDVFNPQEFIPEFTADVGIKKGEKVDYAIVKDGKPAILIEAKSINEVLERHDSQLFRYFGTTSAKFAILTNGLIYRFYTDLDETNKMDSVPFLEINMMDIKENQVPELKKFHKSVFNVEDIFDAASVLKYVNEFKKAFQQLLEQPSDEFVRLFLAYCYSGTKTQTVVEKFRPILKKSLNDYVSEMMNDKIKTALGQSNGTVSKTTDETPQTDAVQAAASISEPDVVTTEEELEAYFLVKNMLRDIVPMSDVTYKDTTAYINVLYKNNTRKWICRFRLTGASKCMFIPGEARNGTKVMLESVYDVENYREQLTEIVKAYI